MGTHLPARIIQSTFKSFFKIKKIHLSSNMCTGQKSFTDVWTRWKYFYQMFFFSRGKRNASSRVNESENKLQCPSSFFFYYNGSHPMANEVKILLSLTSYTWLRRFSILTKDTENRINGHQVILPDHTPSFLKMHQFGSLMGHFWSIF